jgi:two-component system sensor histidine kinase KdpD
MKPGTFRIYLGAAPGVGKTYAMLNEGRRRRSRGTDVVVGFVETHGRPSTAEQIGDLEIVPRKVIAYKGATFEEMDVDAILLRAPQVVLVDELAHTNVPGSRNAKRCEDVEELLAAGITVISTLNIQHLESVNDVVEQITGVKQRETIPDAIVRKAGQVELVDMAPEAIRRRMAHGNIYPPERVDAALGNYFRPGNLAALRELALLWVADRVEEGLADYRDRHGIDRPWETRERILVAITGSEDGDRLIRRGARMAARAHGDLVAVHVASLDGAAQGSRVTLERRKALVEELGGTVKEVAGDDVGDALVAAARSLNATQIILGATRRSRYAELTRGSVINRVIRASGIGIDVHVISREESDAPAESTRRRRRPADLPARRVVLAFGLAAVGLPLLTILLAQLRVHLGLPSILLLYLLAVVLVSATGGLWPALVTGVAGFLLANYYFTPPLHTFTISEGDNFVALIVFLVVAAVVSGFVALASRRAAEGARAAAESEALVRLGGSSSIPTLLETLRRVLGLRGVSLLHHGVSGWAVEASAGDPDKGSEQERRITLDDVHELLLLGGTVSGQDQRIIDAFVAEIAAAIDVEELSAEVRTVGSLVAARDARAALLVSTGRGLQEAAERLRAAAADIEGEAGAAVVRRSSSRLTLLGADLLDLGRIESGELSVAADEVSIADVLAAAVGDTCVPPGRVEIDLDPTLPLVTVDASLLRRALVEAVVEAIDASPSDTPVRVVAGVVWPGVDIRVIDRRRRSAGDSELGAVAGAGAFVAQAFVLAMRGRVEIDETPGGGTTLVIRLPAGTTDDGSARAPASSGDRPSHASGDTQA